MMRKMYNVIEGEARVQKISRLGMGLLVCVACVALPAGTAWSAQIDLTLGTTTPVVNPGETVEVQLWFTADQAPGQEWIAADIWLEWDHPNLTLTGFETNPAIPFVSTSLTPINPDDAEDDVLWSGVGNFGSAFVADSGVGTYVATFEFEAGPTPAVVDIVTLAQHGPSSTYIGDTFGFNVVGLPGGTTVTILPEPGTISLILLGGLLAMKRRRS